MPWKEKGLALMREEFVLRAQKDEIYKPKRFNNIKDTKIRDESIDPSAKIVKALRDGTYDPKIHNCMGGKKRTAEEYIRDMELNEYFEKKFFIVCNNFSIFFIIRVWDWKNS